MCLYNILQGGEKDIKIFLYKNNTLWDFQTVSFLGSYDIRGFFSMLTDVMSHASCVGNEDSVILQLQWQNCALQL